MRDAPPPIGLTRLGTVLVLAALGAPGLEAGKAPKRDADWVLAQVVPLVREDTPHRLRARVELVGNDGSIVPGVLFREWASAERWQQEIRIEDYVDREGAAGEGTWSSRNLPFRPWNVRVPLRALDLELPLQDTRPTYRKVRARDGAPDLACAGIRGAWVCVDAGSGALVLRETLSGRLRYEYGPSRPFGLGLWPESVRLVDEGREIGRLVVQGLEPLPAADAARIRPPEGVEVLAPCRESTDPKILPATKVRPEYPDALRRTRVSGYVLLEATIGEGGDVEDLQPLRASHPGLVAPARTAVEKWRYEPALCDGKPRKTEWEVMVQFVLN